MSQDYIAVARLSRSRNPGTSNAAFKQFVRIRRVIQKSDRPHSAKSRCVKHQEYFRRYPNHDVVGELILSNDVQQLGGRLSPERPEHRPFKRPKRSNFAENIGRHEFFGNLNGAPGAIPTRDLPLRRRTLYATELREHTGSKLTDALFTCPETRRREPCDSDVLKPTFERFLDTLLTRTYTRFAVDE